MIGSFTQKRGLLGRRSTSDKGKGAITKPGVKENIKTVGGPGKLISRGLQLHLSKFDLWISGTGKLAGR
jgi:hypothetical protein